MKFKARCMNAHWLFCFVLGVYLLTSSFRIDSGDGEAMYRVAYALATRGEVAIQPLEAGHELLLDAQGRAARMKGVSGYGMVGRDGRFYAKYGLGWSLVAVPFVALAHVVHPLLPSVEEGLLTRMAVLLVNPLATAAAVSVFYLLARRFYREPTARLLALFLALGTPVWYYARSAFSEPLAMFLLLGALEAFERKRFGWAGVLLGFMLVVRPATFILLPVLLGWFGWRFPPVQGNRKPWMVLLLPLLGGQMVVFGYNWWRFGGPLDFGYRHVGWDTPLFEGLYGLLFSPGKGLFLYAPVLLLFFPGIWLWGKGSHAQRQWRVLAIGLLTVQTLFLAVYRHWDGGGGWGPRLLMPVVPFFVLPIGSVLERWWSQKGLQFFAALLFSLSVTIQVLGLSVNWARHLQKVRVVSSSWEGYLERIHFHWRASPILGQIQALREVAGLLRDPVSRDALKGLVMASSDQVEAQQRLSFNVPDFWPVYAAFLGLNTVFWGVAWGLLAAGTGWCGRRLFKSIAPPTR